MFTLVTRGERNSGRSVRTERWRYIAWNDGRDGEELYDHTRDPEEMHNLADDPQFASVVAGLKPRLHAPAAATAGNSARTR